MSRVPTDGARGAGVNVRSLWRELPPAHRRWIVLNALIVTAVVNLMINAGLAWVGSAGEHRVPLWSVPLVEKPSTVVDTVGTFFLLPLITCLLVTTVARHDVAAGRLPPLGGATVAHALAARLPGTRLRRGLVLGGLCGLVLGPVSVLVLAAIDFSGLTRGEFALYKAVLGVVLGAIVTPVIAVCGMADAPQPLEAAVPAAPEPRPAA